jgi:iron complex transport system ATP-binding protein
MSALLAYRNARLTLRNRTIIERLDLEVKEGERVALVGANGAGKTTILRAALGLIPIAEGDVALMGEAPTGLAASERARRAAYLPQRAAVAWPMNVEALAALGRFTFGGPLGRLSDEDRAAVERAVQAADVAHLRARSLDTLSGGEQARAHLARALAQEAPLLALDEPTANLDPAQSTRVAEIIAAQSKRGVVIFATHDFGVALRAATRVLVIAEGRVLTDAPPRDAFAPHILKKAFDREGRIVDTGAGPCVVFA